MLAMVGAVPAQAAETTNSEIVLIRQGDVVDDDLYATAISVRVTGVIDGDLIAFAAEQVVIDGRVTGSVTVVAPRVVVDGTIEGSLRLVVNDLVVGGTVGGDVVGVGADLRFGSDSRVEGEILAWTYRMEAMGSIGSRLGGTQRHLDLAGAVGGSVDVTVNRLRVVGPLTVGGDLVYRSRHSGEGLDQAEVAGTQVQRQPLPPNLRVRALGALARVMAVIFLGIAAVTTVWGWPDRTAMAADQVGAHPLRAWLGGASVFLSPVLVVLVAGLVIARAPPAAGVPLLALAVPIFFALLGVLLVVSLVAGVPVSAWTGRQMFRRWGVHGSTLAGSLVLGMVWLLPWVGLLVPLVALPLGLGAWLRALRPQEVVAAPSDESAVSASS